jgi:hypothetical protein
LIDAGQTSVILSDIVNQKPFNTIYSNITQNYLYVSNTVLRAVLGSNFYTKQEKKQLFLAVSPLTKHIQSLIEVSNLPRGYKNQIANAQQGYCKMEEVYSLLSSTFSDQVQLYDELIRYFYSDTVSQTSIVKANNYIRLRAGLFKGTVRPRMEASFDARDSISASFYLDTLQTQEGNNAYVRLKEKQLQKINKNFGQEMKTNLQLKADVLQVANDASQTYANVQANAMLQYIDLSNYIEPIYELNSALNGSRVKLTNINNEDNMSNFAIKVFPNPASANENCQFDWNGKYENAEIEILNTLGDAIDIIKIPENATEIIWRPSSELTGIYFYRFISEGKVLKTEKLIFSK